VTNFWVGSTWKSSDAAQTQLNNDIDAYHHGQGSLFDDLRLEIESFARSDAAAGHPPPRTGVAKRLQMPRRGRTRT
jgi:hypothetical protein